MKWKYYKNGENIYRHKSIRNNRYISNQLYDKFINEWYYFTNHLDVHDVQLNNIDLAKELLTKTGG